jgi:hypothetical protein
MTTTTTLKSIKAKLGLRQQKAEVVLTTSLHVWTNFFASAYFTASGTPAPPVDQAKWKADNDALQAAIAAAATGAKLAITAKNHAKEVVITDVEQTAAFVTANSKGDMIAFESSGFTPVASTKTKTPPVSETIKKIVPSANSGQMDVTLMKFPKASSYEIRVGLPGAGGTPPTTWTTIPVTSIRSAATVPNLTPGLLYVFQARAVVNGGYTDYGDPLARIAV